MDILDASSTAIYGSRGANGVIPSLHTKVNRVVPPVYLQWVCRYESISKYPMMNGSNKFAEMRKLAGKFENSVDRSDDVDTDWQDLMFRDSYVNSHDVSVSGGTNGGGYSFGAAYYKDQRCHSYSELYPLLSAWFFRSGCGKIFPARTGEQYQL